MAITKSSLGNAFGLRFIFVITTLIAAFAALSRVGYLPPLIAVSFSGAVFLAMLAYVLDSQKRIWVTALAGSIGAGLSLSITDFCVDLHWPVRDAEADNTYLTVQQFNELYFRHSVLFGSIALLGGVVLGCFVWYTMRDSYSGEAHDK